MAGKGDKPRPYSVDRKTYEDNYDKWLRKVKKQREKEKKKDDN